MRGRYFLSKKTVAISESVYYTVRCYKNGKEAYSSWKLYWLRQLRYWQGFL